MFGISGGEIFVVLLVIVIVVGPQRLPEYTGKLAQAIRRLRVFLDDTKTQIAAEVGPELGDLNLADLDPRNYDPRKIVRDALGEDLDAIRKDLTSPFTSVAEAVKGSSDEAADAVNGTSRSKSLKTMIDEKAEERRAEKAAGAPAGQASTGSTVLPEAAAASDAAAVADRTAEAAPAGETPAPARTGSTSLEGQGALEPELSAEAAAAQGEAVTAELPQVTPDAVSERSQRAAGPDGEANPDVAPVDDLAGEAAAVEESGTGEALVGDEPAADADADADDEAPTAEDEAVEDPERRALLGDLVDAAGDVVDDVASIVDLGGAEGDGGAGSETDGAETDGAETDGVEPEARRDAVESVDVEGEGTSGGLDAAVPPSSADAPAGDAAGAAAGKQDGAVPSTLLNASGVPVEAPMRPISPREIVRAANEAARTRAEAAEARLSA